MEKTIFTPLRPAWSADGSLRWVVAALSMALLLLVGLESGEKEFRLSGEDGQGQLSAAVQGEISQGAHTIYIYRCANSPELSFSERLPGRASSDRSRITYPNSGDQSAQSANAIRGPSKPVSEFCNRFLYA
jgi:hypothetical protein